MPPGRALGTPATAGDGPSPAGGASSCSGTPRDSPGWRRTVAPGDFFPPAVIKWDWQEHHQDQEAVASLGSTPCSSSQAEREPGHSVEDIMTLNNKVNFLFDLFRKTSLLYLPRLCLNQPVPDRAPSLGFSRVNTGTSILASQREAESNRG